MQFESELALSGMFELLWPLRHRLPELPHAQRLAAEALLAAEGLPGTDLFALAAGALSLLSLEAERRPVLVVVDDCHWLDSLSSQAMAFALRRLDVDAVAALLTYRPGQTDPLPGPWRKVVLSGIDGVAADRLLREQLGQPVPAEVAQRMVELTGGNPLALIEAARLLDTEELTAAVPLPDPLPMGARGTVSFGARLADLPDRTRQALALVCLAGAAPTPAISRSLTNAGVGPSDLGPAERAEVISIRDGRPIFSHPLVRAAAVAELDPAARRKAHAAIADALEHIDIERHAWHLAAAATGPSESIASALDRAAANATRRGGTAAAASTLALSAQLSPAGPSRTDRLIRAGQALFLAGRYPQASEIVDQLIRTGDSGARTYALLLQGSLATWSETAPDAPPVLWAAFEELAQTSPDLAAIVGLQLGAVLASLGLLKEMHLATCRVRELTLSDPTLQFAARCSHSLVSMMLGDRRPFDDMEREMSLPELLASVVGPGTETLYALAQTWVFAERFDTARQMLEAMIDAARSKSAASILPFPLFIRADLEWRVGRLAEAKTDAEEALAIAEVTGVGRMSSYGHTVRARASATEGDEKNCREHAQLALGLARSLEQRPVELYSNHALGLLELGRGRWKEAVAHLQANLEVEAWIGARSPVLGAWRADYVEALAGAGRTGQALEELDNLERQGRAAQSPWALAASLRCRALLADKDWETFGHQAIAELEDFPLDQARTHLIVGERLRRERRPTDARRHLRSAAHMFVLCGATPWATRAERELHASGGRSHRGHALGQSLTPREGQVCKLAADGATNKEIAAALFISQKTVEYHLQNAFLKLGVSNRTQAARLLDRA
jgi:DNA-binding CsgD family transcriptional regulator